MSSSPLFCYQITKNNIYFAGIVRPPNNVRSASICDVFRRVSVRTRAATLALPTMDELLDHMDEDDSSATPTGVSHNDYLTKYRRNVRRKLNDGSFTVSIKPTITLNLNNASIRNNIILYY